MIVSTSRAPVWKGDGILVARLGQPEARGGIVTFEAATLHHAKVSEGRGNAPLRSDAKALARAPQEREEAAAVTGHSRPSALAMAFSTACMSFRFVKGARPSLMA